MNNMIGHRIKERRKELHITPKQIHAETGISTGNLSGIETGKSLPSASALIGLSKILNCTTDWILTGEAPISESLDCSNNREQMLLEGFRILNDADQLEIVGLLDIKLKKYNEIKRDREKMEKSVILTTTDGEDPREKMA